MAASLLDGRKYFRNRANAIYQVLAQYPQGLMVDVGAASGYTAGTMVRMSPDSRVIAFEPFPGNHRYFKEHIGTDPRITLDTRAVSDGSGQATFTVPDISVGNEPGWEGMAGYSSLGMLGSQKGVARLEVETCALDDVLGEEPVRFLKIDTQGAELRVLQGCERLFSSGLVDVAFVEFDGSIDVLQFLTKRGFIVVTTEHVIIPSKSSPGSRWEIIRDSILSTGVKTFKAWPAEHRSDADEYCAFLLEEKAAVGSVWTDLVCIAPHALADFMFAAGRLDAQVPPDHAISIKIKPNV